jgi:lysozyme family protein
MSYWPKDNQEIITRIFVREGWDIFTNDPDDRGGPTRYGITLATLRKWRLPSEKVDVQSVMTLTETQARAILVSEYIIKPGFNLITDMGLRHVLVDFAVNSGADDAVPALQRVLGVRADGHLGPVTAEAANRYEDQRHLRNRVCVERVLHNSRIAKADVTQLKWLIGWQNRATSFIE